MTHITKTTERGWAGHFICADRCKFRRNTLIEYGDERIVVSTIGNYEPMHIFGEIDSKIQRQIGADRTYETMAFKAKWDGTYWDADVSKEVFFKSPWALSELSHESDQKANEMHEKVVTEIIELLTNNNK